MLSVQKSVFVHFRDLLWKFWANFNPIPMYFFKILSECSGLILTPNLVYMTFRASGFKLYKNRCWKMNTLIEKEDFIMLASQWPFGLFFLVQPYCHWQMLSGNSITKCELRILCIIILQCLASSVTNNSWIFLLLIYKSWIFSVVSVDWNMYWWNGNCKCSLFII